MVILTSKRGSAHGNADCSPPSDPSYDIEFFWDPVCPFAWITSRWVVKVAAQRNFAVDWRFISLRLLNKHKDYATEFPPEYEQGHTAGLRMLRVAAAVRHDQGRDPLGALVTAYGESYWDKPKGSGMRTHLSTTEHAVEVLTAAGLATDYADALDDTSWDTMLDAETELALSRTAAMSARRSSRSDRQTACRSSAPSFRGSIRCRRPAVVGRRHCACSVPRLRRDEAVDAGDTTTQHPRRHQRYTNVGRLDRGSPSRTSRLRSGIERLTPSRSSLRNGRSQI
ncbi:MAG: hypothetical protein R2710_20005 [Acidimicrobiales bacterium]